MKKILIGYIMDGKHSGIDKYLINFIKTIYKKNITIDILTNKIDKDLQEKIKLYNAKLIEIPRLKHPIKQYKKMKQIIKKNKYDIAYFNISETFNCIGIYAAKKCKVEKIVIHSHASGSDEHNKVKRKLKEFLNSFFKYITYRFGTMYLACSNKAGMWLYPKKIMKLPNYKIIYNAIDFEKFRFKQDVREEQRKKLGINDELVLGHIGNFCYQKNQDFLIEIAKELRNKDFDFKMLLIGIGDDFERVKQKITLYNLKNHVELLGLRSDVNLLLQAMDIFLLPSNFEGLPISGIEAQISGLDCLFSKKITDEVCITKKAKMLDINDEKIWIDEIIKIRNHFNREEIIMSQDVKKYSLENQSAQFYEIIE